jgi:hypothetical protein
MVSEHRIVTEEPDYRSYLLRFWRVTSDGQAIWRASLECPHTGERTGFASLDALFDHLKADIAPTKKGGES